MMFYSDVLPSAYPATLRPCHRRHAYRPYSMRMRGYTPYVMPLRHVRPTSNSEDFFSHLLSFADMDRDFSTDSEDQEMLSFIPFLCHAASSSQTGNGKKHPKKSQRTLDGRQLPVSDATESKSTKKSEAITESSDPDCDSASCDLENLTIRKLDMRGIDPRNISVKTNAEKKTITVSARRVRRSPFGCEESERTHVFPIPEGTAPRDIRSFLSPEGVFYLQAPKRTPALTNKPQAREDDAENDNGDELTTRNNDEITDNNDDEMNKDNNDETDETELDSGALQDDHTQMETGDNSDDITDAKVSQTDESTDAEQQPASGHSSAEQQPASEHSSSQQQPASEHSSANNDNTISVRKQDDEKVVTLDVDSHVTQQASDKRIVEHKTTDDDVTQVDDVILSKIDMCGFAPSDITFKVCEQTGNVEISAKHEEKTDNGMFVKHTFRSFPLPTGVTAEDLKSHLSSDGIFYLKTQKRQAALTE